jgi:mRNA interferase MazF
MLAGNRRKAAGAALVAADARGGIPMPGNVFLPTVTSGLPKDSVLNVTALVTVDKADLGQPVGRLPDSLMGEIDRGLRRVLGL